MNKIEQRRAHLLRNLRTLDIVSFSILAILLIWLVNRIFTVAADPDADNEAVLQVMLYFWGAISLQVAIMIRSGFVRLNAANQVSEDKTDGPFRGIRLSWFAPVLAMVILLPALIAGIFNDDSTGTVASFFLMFLMVLVAYLGSALVAAFIIAPVELLIRGLYALVTGDKKRAHYAIIGLIIASLTAFIAIGSMAIDTNSSSRYGQVVAALLGIPGSYEVTSEPLLWAARGIIIALTAFFVWVRVAGKRHQKNTTR